MEIIDEIRAYLRDKVVVTELETARQQIVANIESKGIRASGRTQNSLQVQVVDGAHARLVSVGEERVAPLPTLEVGRGPGGVPRNLEEILLQWAADKGLPWAGDIKVARAVKWKIARRGTERHTKHEEVYSDIMADTEQRLRAATTAGVVESAGSVLRNFIRRAFR